MTEHDVFAAAVLLTGVPRATFLDVACGEDGQLRRKVEALLQAHDEAGGQAPRRTDRQLEATLLHSTLVEPGTMIAGRYKLIEPVGEGGMGTVWMAEQKSPVKRKVAVKLIKPGMDSRAVLARFEAERQALAVMDHPHIAKVFDGGMTEQGRPYFVMELVRGIPLTDYCDHAQLTVRKRLELFGQVCSAVQHAHQKGIIHRDLKPSNVLVAEHDGRPIVKVIDFGLAKALHGAHALTDLSLNTAFGAVLGTPLYMAPEQLAAGALDIDTRSDLYSLGVILYELLTGTTPIDQHRLKNAAWDEIRRIVREEEPPRPSTRLSSSETLPSLAAKRHVEPARLTSLVRGDLDWIIMKSLEKDRNRRYETANGLAMDIQRSLAGEAVLAAPASRAYRLKKFLRRHKGPVLAAILLLLALLGGVAGTSYGLFWARQAAFAEREARTDAQNRQQEAEQQRSRAELREQIAINAVKRFRDAVAGNPELKYNAGLQELRGSLLKEPLEFFKSLRERLLADQDTRRESLARLASAMSDLGKLTNQIGDKADALRAFEESREIYDRLAKLPDADADSQFDLIQCDNNIGLLRGASGQSAAALDSLQRARDAAMLLVAQHASRLEFQSYLAVCHNNIGELLRQNGRTDEALASHEKARELREQLLRDNAAEPQIQGDLAATYNNIGLDHLMAGRVAAALEAHERAREIAADLVEVHPRVAEFRRYLGTCHNNIGELLRESGRPDEALAAYEKALEHRQRLSKEHPTATQFGSDLAATHNNIGIALVALGRVPAALDALERAREIAAQLASDNPSVTEFQRYLAACHNNIGERLRESGRLDEALAAHTQALEIRERFVIANPTSYQVFSELGATLHNLALIDVSAKRFGQARDKLLQAIERQKKALAANPGQPTYRYFLQAHCGVLLSVAAALNDADLAREARRVLGEAAATDPQAASLDQRMAEVLAGNKPKDAQELVALAQRAYDMQRFTLAARFQAEALQGDAALADSRQTQLAYMAACSAALAASGLDNVAPKLDEQAKAAFRGQALALLRDELGRWTAHLAVAAPEQRPFCAQTLAHWQTDPDLVGLRGEAIETLPESERQAWRTLWEAVEQLRQNAAEKPTED